MVEDDDMNAAIRAIREAGFLEKTTHYRCSRCYGYTTPENKVHVHMTLMDGDANYCFRFNPHPITRNDYPSDKSFVAALGNLDKQHGFSSLHYPHIGLYLKSQLMWTMPKFSLDDPPENDEHFMRASDIRLPGVPPLLESRYSPAYGQVVVLTPAAFVQVTILSVIRCAQLIGEIKTDNNFSMQGRLLRLPETVAPHFQDDVLDILDYDRFPEGIRGIWRFVNALEPERRPVDRATCGRYLGGEEKEAFDRRVLQVGKRMADEGNLPAILDSWFFTPSQELVLR